MNTSVRRLDEVCSITMGQAPPGDSYNTLGDGLPLIAGAGDFDGDRPAAKKFTSIASKVCAPGDIILGIRASIGAKVWADEKYCLGRGVAGLRPTSALDARYLWHWLGNSSAALKAKGRGATFLQVNRNDIGEMLITLPPIEEQRRIAAILDEAEGLRAKRRRSRVLLDELEASVFVEMFGDPDEAIRAGRTVPLSEVVADLQGGKNLVASDPDALTQNRVLKISSVTTGRFDPTESKPLPNEFDPPSDYFVRAGDLLFSRANTTELVGATAYVVATPANLVLPDKLWRFVWRRPDKVEPLYVWALFQSPAMRRQLSSRSSGTGGSMKNISKAKMATLPLPWPDHEHQVAFAKRLRAIHRLDHFADGGTEDTLFASLQARAFAGRLWEL